jgi:hypothetical protein
MFMEVLNNLAVVYLKTDMTQQALELFKWCYQKKVAVGGPNSPSVISTIFNVAECYTRLEQYNNAMVLLKDLKNLLVGS